MINKNNNTNHSYIFFFFVFFYIFLLNLTQVITQHWTAILDQDTVMIYNSLLIINGYNQEYTDHPGYAFLFFLGIIYKICFYFYSNNIFSLDEIIKSAQIDHHNFQILFYIARWVNSLVVFLIFIFYYKVSRILKINQKIIFLSIIIIITSNSFFEVIFYIRNEGFSLLFFLISFFEILKFFEKKNYKYIFYSGFFFTFAMLAKIQIIILFILPFLLIPVLIKIKNAKNTLIKLKKIFIIQNFIFLLFYLFFQTIIIYLSNENQRMYYDVIFFITCLILYLLYSKKFIKLEKEELFVLNNILAVFSLGAVILLIILKIIDILNIIKLSNYVLLRLTNPIHYSLIYTNLSNKVSFFTNISAVLKSFHVSEITFSIFIIISSIFFLIKFKEKDKYKNTLHIIFLLHIIILVGSNFLRRPYFFYTIIMATIFFNVLSKNFHNKIVQIINVFIIIIFLTNTISSKIIYSFFNTQNNSKLICEDSATRKYMKYYHNKFDENFLNKFCQ
jgi:hypothetical protein